VQFGPDGHVPGVSIAVGYLLVLTSIAMLVMYVQHIGRSLRVSALIELVGNDTRRLLDHHYPERLSDSEPDPDAILAETSGVVTSIDCDRLVELAATSGTARLHVIPAVGTYVPAGAPLIRVERAAPSLDRAEVLCAVSLGLERTLDDDVAYGFRMLVDMAERSLADSPFLDPTTAMQSIDRLHDGLRQLVGRVIPDGRYNDSSGELRLTVPAMDWDAFVHLAFDEVRLAGAESPQISRRLLAALHDLLDVAPVERRPVLEEQVELLQQAIGALPRDQRDLDMSLTPDVQGIGVAASDGQRARQSGSPTHTIETERSRRVG